MKVAYHGITDWRLRREEQGHRWMGGYVDGVLVTVRCEHCDNEPINVMRTDFTPEPCRRAARGNRAEGWRMT